MVTYRFGEYHLQPTERRLMRNGVDIPLAPRAFDMLVVLVEHAGSLVTKEELLRAVWRDAAVEEANLGVTVSTLRRAIGYDAVMTVPKYGYRFVAEVRAAGPGSATGPEVLAGRGDSVERRRNPAGRRSGDDARSTR